jgi:hypothetical protein
VAHGKPDLEVDRLALDAGAYFEATGPEQGAIIAASTTVDFDWPSMVPDRLKKRYPILKQSWQFYIMGVMERAKEEKKGIAALKGMYQQTKQGLSVMREVVDPSQKQGELDGLHEKEGRLKHQLEVLDKQIRKAVAAGKATDDDHELQRLLKLALAHGDHPDDNPNTWATRITENVKLELQAKGKKGFLDAEAYASLSSQLGGAKQLANGLKTAVDELQANMEEAKAVYAELNKESKCPTCGTKGPGFKKAIKSAYDDQLLKLNQERNEKQTRYSEAVLACNVMETRIAKAREINAVLGEIYKAERSLQAEKLRNDLRTRIADLEKKIEARQQEAEDVTEAEQAKYNVECELQDLSEEIGDLAVEVRDIQHAQSQRRQLAETEERLKQEETKLAAISQDISDLTALRDKFTILSLKPILEKVAVFTKGIFDAELQLDGGEIGRFVGPKWVPLRQFSGTEQMVAMAALTCALGGQNNYVIVDELGTMDDTHLGKFLLNVHKAITLGVVTQFFGFTTPREKLRTTATIINI